MAKWGFIVRPPSPLFLSLEGLDCPGYTSPEPLLSPFPVIPSHHISVLAPGPTVVWTPRLARMRLCIVHTYKYVFYVDRDIFCK